MFTEGWTENHRKMIIIILKFAKAADKIHFLTYFNVHKARTYVRLTRRGGSRKYRIGRNQLL
jgi:hypothetical protein